MDEAEFAAKFVSKNIGNIWELGKTAYGKLDETIKLKLKTSYGDYLSNTEKRYSKSKSFFIRDESVDLYSYYVPVGIGCRTQQIDTPSFRNCIDSSKHMIISGSGGSGKSVLMRHLFLDCIRDNVYVPVLIELREINADHESLDDLIFSSLDRNGFKLSQDYITKAKSEGHFAFFLDGFDEVEHKLRKKLLKDIKTIAGRFSSCPVLISTRPEEVFNSIDEFDIFRIIPLDLEKAISLVEKLPFDLKIKKNFVRDLKGGVFDKHESFLSNPLLLSIMLLTYGENAEIPTKISIFYNQAFEALFQRHDANKGGYKRSRLTKLDIQDFSRVFSLFSLQTYDKRLFKMARTDCLSFLEKSAGAVSKEFDTDDYLTDLLGSVCLLVEDGLEISYSHRSFQEYFVAIHILSASPDVQKALINRYWKISMSDEVINLLLEMNPELIERTLIIPELEKLFSKIGVTRKVGVTHTTKYLKLCFESINLEADGISATWSSSNSNSSMLAGIAIQRAGISKKLSEEQVFDYKNFRDYLVKKYTTGKRRSVFKTKEMSYKTPILAEILESNTFVSVAHLQRSYDAFKILKNKHSNTKKSLEELLGI
jgi:predicted NACHT family NTPase